MTTRLALLLLLGLSASVSAREVRLQSPSGESGQCPEVAAAAAEATAPAKPHVATTPAPPRPKAGKPASARGDSEPARVSAPRWHSFLPGMFR